jgi:soluble lytic murein transglycosylase-like protein
VTYFLWILFAGTALAQTASTAPPSADKPAPAPAPTIAEKTAAAPTIAEKAPAAAKPAETFQSAMAKQRAAIAIQRAAVRQQSESAVPWQLAAPGSEATPGSEAADCDRIADPELTPLIDSAATKHQVEPKLLRGVIEQESGFRACAISAKGAKGLMQLMPATVEQFKVDDVFDPKQNIEAGATYLRQLMDKYKGDIKLALAAYNAGPTTVDQSGGIPDIKETQDYVEGIIKKMR